MILEGQLSRSWQHHLVTSIGEATMVVNIHEKAFYAERIKEIQQIVNEENQYDDLDLTVHHTPNSGDFALSGIILRPLGNSHVVLHPINIYGRDADSREKIKEAIVVMQTDYLKLKEKLKNG